MVSLFYTHAAGLAHETPRGHPERGARLEAILAALRDKEFAGLERRIAPLAAATEVLRCHSAAHLARIEATQPQSG